MALDLVDATSRPDLLAPPTAACISAWDGPALQVAPIDAALADTAAFCAAYDVLLEESANCVIVQGRRGETTTIVACVVLATTRADVNGLVRRRLEARKASFAPMELAVAETGMEFGGITPFGLPSTWPILIDARVHAAPQVVVGSGIRGSKLVVPGSSLARLPGAEVVEDLALPA